MGAVAQELVDQIAVRGVELDTVEPGGKRVSRRPRVIVEQAGDFGDVERARLGISLLARIGMAFARPGRHPSRQLLVAAAETRVAGPPPMPKPPQKPTPPTHNHTGGRHPLFSPITPN